MKPVFIDRTKLMEFDIFTSTSFGFIGGVIRLLTWGLPGIGNMWKGTHTGFVVKHENEWKVIEMMPTSEMLRYVHVNKEKIIDPDEFINLPPEVRSLYKAVTIKTGFQMNPLSNYEHDVFGCHFVFVGRLPLMNDEKREVARKYVMDKIESGIPYDYSELITFPFGKDTNKGEDICSRLVYNTLQKVVIDQPANWKNKVSPADYQRWPALQSIPYKLV